MSETVYILSYTALNDIIYVGRSLGDAMRHADEHIKDLEANIGIEAWRVGADIDSGAWSRQDDGTWYYLDARG